MTYEDDAQGPGEDPAVLIFKVFLTDIKSLIKWAVWVTYPTAPAPLCHQVAIKQAQYLYGRVVGNAKMADIRVQSPRIFRACVKWLGAYLNQNETLCEEAMALLTGQVRDDTAIEGNEGPAADVPPEDSTGA